MTNHILQQKTEARSSSPGIKKPRQCANAVTSIKATGVGSKSCSNLYSTYPRHSSNFLQFSAIKKFSKSSMQLRSIHVRWVQKRQNEKWRPSLVQNSLLSFAGGNLCRRAQWAIKHSTLASSCSIQCPHRPSNVASLLFLGTLCALRVSCEHSKHPCLRTAEFHEVICSFPFPYLPFPQR